MKKKIFKRRSAAIVAAAFMATAMTAGSNSGLFPVSTGGKVMAAEITSKYKQPDHDVVNDEIHKNKTGQIIQIVAIVVWVLGVILAFIMLKSDGMTSLPLILGYLFAVFVSGLIIYGLGEIIILLGQINNKMPKKIK